MPSPTTSDLDHAAHILPGVAPDRHALMAWMDDDMAPESASDNDATSPDASAPAAGDSDGGAHFAQSSSATPVQAPAAPAAPIGTPVAPVSHTSREVKIEIEKGSWSAAGVVTLELGNTGIGLGESGNDRAKGAAKMLETTSAAKLNGLAGKLEASLMNGEGELALVEGLKISLEVNALTAGTDGDELDLDLGSVSAKVVGDAGQLFDLPAGMTATLDVRFTFTIGGATLAKLASVLAREREYVVAAKEAAAYTDDLAARAKDYREAVAQRDVLRASGKQSGDAAFDALERKIAEHQKTVPARAKGLRQIVERASKARQNLVAASQNVQGKIGKRLAKLVGERGLKLGKRFLAKLIPGLNLVSTAFYLLEIASIINELRKNGLGDSAEGEGAGDKPVGEPGQQPPEPGPATPTLDEAAAARARLDALPKRAHKLLGMMRKSDRAVSLDPDQLATVGSLVQGLDDAALAEVAKALDGDQPAATPEAAIAAVDAAVKRVKNPSGMASVKINGVLRRDVAVDLADGEESPTSAGPSGAVEPADSSQDAEPSKARITSPGGGPITSPPREQLHLDDPMTVARHMPAEILGRWFRVHGGNLLQTSEFKAWQASLRSLPSTRNGERNFEVDPTIEETQRGWSLVIAIKYTVGDADKVIRHSYLVFEDHEGLRFEPFTVHDVR